MDSIISTFHIDWKIILAQAVNFGVVFVILYIFALKPLAKLMEERSEKINKGILDAKTNAETLLKTEAEYDEMLSRAKKEAAKIFEGAKLEAENKKAAMLEETKKEVFLMIESGKKTLETEKIKMVENAKKEVANLAILATEKLIGEKRDLNNL